MRERRVKGDGSVYDRRRRGGARIEASIRSRSPTSVNINRSVSLAPLALAIALVADFALRLRGSPYRYGGATIDGFDCSGLVFYAHRALGLTVPRTSRDQADDSTDVKAKKLRPGDLVFFKIDSRRVNHVGIYVGDHRFVHAPGKGKPVTTNSLNDEFYAKRFFSAGRYWNRLPQ
jgi:cell wall-associated NlpC family hydrolase